MTTRNEYVSGPSVSIEQIASIHGERMQSITVTELVDLAQHAKTRTSVKRRARFLVKSRRPPVLETERLGELLPSPSHPRIALVPQIPPALAAKRVNVQPPEHLFIERAVHEVLERAQQPGSLEEVLVEGEELAMQVAEGGLYGSNSVS
jgi:hypothetical protein